MPRSSTARRLVALCCDAPPRLSHLRDRALDANGTRGHAQGLEVDEPAFIYFNMNRESRETSLLSKIVPLPAKGDRLLPVLPNKTGAM
eukprot:1317390-Amorphochlora_amoeboformis.AAC.3